MTVGRTRIGNGDKEKFHAANEVSLQRYKDGTRMCRRCLEGRGSTMATRRNSTPLTKPLFRDTRMRQGCVAAVGSVRINYGDEGKD
jgi:hypothetical protein